MDKEMKNTAQKILDRTSLFDNAPYDIENYFETESLIDIISEARSLCKDIVGSKEDTKCDYCDENNKIDDFHGGDGIIYSEKDNKYYLITEHFRGEVQKIEAHVCLKCGRKLEPK
jgi:hypothetical protein